MKARPTGLNCQEINNSVRANPVLVRLQVFLAHSGAASRRASEKIIQEGRVRVNGAVVTAPGEKVAPGDTVCLDGVPVKAEVKRYLLLNKPPGYLCSSFDREGRPLALELLPKEIHERLYNVGRLDYRSSGLVIFTNDGDFAAAVGHPRSDIEKEYIVEAAGSVPDEFIRSFEKGIIIEGIRYKAKRVERVGRRVLKVVLVEGKNREIRRLFSHFHLHPDLLRRVRIGPVHLGDLPEGAVRPLTTTEINTLEIMRQESRRESKKW
jgi:23S rRNA pseudouridine2605 synthase